MLMILINTLGSRMTGVGIEALISFLETMEVQDPEEGLLQMEEQGFIEIHGQEVWLS